MLLEVKISLCCRSWYPESCALPHFLFISQSHYSYSVFSESIVYYWKHYASWEVWHSKFSPFLDRCRLWALLSTSHTASSHSSLSSWVVLSKALLPAQIMHQFCHCATIKNILSSVLQSAFFLNLFPLQKLISFPLYCLTCCHCSFNILLKH